MSHDVVVVGAGIVGASTAWELARRGIDVCLLDRGEVASGTTGLGEGNVLSSDKDAGPELALTLLGLEVYDELDDLLGDEARIRRKGALIVHPDERTWAAEPERVRRLQAAGVDDARLVTPDEARELEPQLTGPLHGATFVPRDLQCDPRAIARALAREAAALGATIRTGADVARVEVLQNWAQGVQLRSGERVTGLHTVVAAGPWSAPLVRDAGLELPLEPRRGQLARLRLPAPDPGFLRRKVVDGSYLLSVASEDPGLQVSTVVETTWDGHVLVGSSRERCGFDHEVREATTDAMRERAQALVPGLRGLPVDTTWVGFRPWLPDGLPAIGMSRRVGGLSVCTGHEGAGVALGPVSGRLLAAVLAGEEPQLDLRPFDPDRFAD